MLLLSKTDIEKNFTMRDAIEADKVAFSLLSAEKCDAPIRTNISASKHNGCFLFMPAYAEDLDVAALKIVDVFPDNAKKGLPTCPAQVMLIDGKTGVILAVLDGTFVTQIRTGASTGVAFDVLARKDSKIGALIGTGGQAEAQLSAMLEARKLDEVRVFSRNFDTCSDFVEQMKMKYSSYRTNIVAVKSSDDAIDNADVIATATTSNTPVFDGHKVKKGATVSCVGSYLPQMQEMDSVILERCSKLFFDSKEAVLSEAGDILIPLEKGIINEQSFTGDIGEVLLGEKLGRENEEEIIVFKSVGVAIQDLVTAKYIYDIAVQKNVGQEWSSDK